MNYIQVIFLLIALSSAYAQTNSDEILEYEHDGCLWPFFSKDNGKPITNQTEFENIVRKDASLNRCVGNLERIDFEKYVLVGHIINSGHCYRPPGLNYFAEYAANSKTLYLTITYQEASRNATCRAASRYDLWLLIPRPSDDFEVVLRLNALDATEHYLENEISRHHEDFKKQLKTFFSFAEQRQWNKILDATYPKLFSLQPRDKMLQALKQSYDSEHLKMYFSDFKYNNDAVFFKADSLQCAIADYSSTIQVEFLQKNNQTDAEFEDYLTEMQTKFRKQYPNSDLIKKENVLHITGPKQLLGVYNTSKRVWYFLELSKSSSQLLALLFEKDLASKIIEATQLD